MTSAEWSASNDPEPMIDAAMPAASDRKRRLYAVACCRRVAEWLMESVGLIGQWRDDDYREAIDVAERFAEGRATARELGEAFEGADDSAFCNDPILDGATADEIRRATFGNAPGWTARLQSPRSAEERASLEADPDPGARIEALDDDLDYLAPGLDPFRDVAGDDAALVGEAIGRMVLLRARHHGGPAREAEERAAQAHLAREIFGDLYPPAPFDPAWRTAGVMTVAEGIEADRAFDRLPILADALEAAGCTDAPLLAHCRGGGPHVPGCWALDLILGKE